MHELRHSRVWIHLKMAGRRKQSEIWRPDDSDVFSRNHVHRSWRQPVTSWFGWRAANLEQIDVLVLQYATLNAK